MDVVQGDMTNLNQDETLGEAESCFLHKLIFILRLPFSGIPFPIALLHITIRSPAEKRGSADSICQTTL